MVTKAFISFCVFCALSLLCVATSVAQVHIEVSPRSGELDDQFVLSVVIESAEQSGAPRLSPSDDFGVAYIGPQSSVSIINGVVNRKVAFNYRLLPRHEGVLTTPAVEVEVGGKEIRVEPLQVKVSVASTPAPQRVQGVSIRQSIEPRNLFVGQQADLTLELQAAINLIEPQFVDLSYDGFWAETIAENERSSKVSGGDQYDIVRFRKALFPLTSGTLVIPARKLKAQVRDMRRNKPFPFGGFDPFDMDVFDQFFGGGPVKEIVVESNPLTVEVKELPSPPAGLPLWGASSPVVGETTLSATVPSDTLKVGESRTLEVIVLSTGNLSPLKGAQIAAPESLKLYEDAPESKNFESAGTLMSKKVFRVSVVPLSGGSVTIPPIQLGYFDTTEGEYRIAKTKEIVLNVEGPISIAAPQPQLTAVPTAKGTSATPLVAVPKSLPLYEEQSFFESLQERFSRSALGLFLLTIAALLSLLWKVRRNRLGSQNERNVLAKIDSASSIAELHAAFRDLLQLKLQRRGDELGVEQLRAVLRRSALEKATIFAIESLLDEYDAALYSQGYAGALDDLREKTFKASRLL